MNDQLSVERSSNYGRLSLVTASWYRIWKDLHHGRLPISSTSGLTAGNQLHKALFKDCCCLFLSFRQNEKLSLKLSKPLKCVFRPTETSDTRGMLAHDWNFLLAACLLEVCIHETAPERLGVTLA